MKQRFLRCSHCGNIVGVVKDMGVPMLCCGQKMEELVPGAVDASAEKHVPVFTVDGNKVYVIVGEVTHPASEEHHIEWISIQTKFGNQRKCIEVGSAPASCFSLCNGDEVEAVYAYCNLHGLWMAENVVEPVCDLAPATTDTNENYTVCKCNNVKYFDILDAVNGSTSLDSLLSAFDAVKNTTKCSTGCGGCYNRVLTIISDVIDGKKA